MIYAYVRKSIKTLSISIVGDESEESLIALDLAAGRVIECVKPLQIIHCKRIAKIAAKSATAAEKSLTFAACTMK